MLQRRLFVGIPLSSALASRLSKEMTVWPKDVFLKTDKTNLHITLFFLGFVHEALVPEICEKVRALCEARESFEIEFSGIRFLPSPEEAKMVWLAGEPSDALRDLKTALERELSFVVSSEPKVYRPHVTLARMKKARFQKLDPKPVIEKDIYLVEPIDTVVVYESVMEEGKRKYVPLESVPLI
jgi:2'-5' RNA ligase